MTLNANNISTETEVVTTQSAKTNKKGSKRNLVLGLSILLVDICLSVSAQLVLKTAMKSIGVFNPHENILHYIVQLIHPLVILGLALYGIATILWIICLSKLDLSFAYPVATLQYFLIFLGAWYLFGENIPLMRLLGLFIISAGVIVISLDKELI